MIREYLKALENAVRKGPARFDPGIGPQGTLRNAAEEGCCIGLANDAIGAIAGGKIELADRLSIAVDQQLARPIGPGAVSVEPCGIGPVQLGKGR